MKSPTVSIVTIFLNAERFLDEAVASVRSQTFTDWQLLLVDDGSTDQSTSLARAFAEAAPDRIRYVEHPGHRNLGMSASRNAGAKLATGTWLCFLDSDDVWRPNHLESLLQLADRHPEAEAIYGPAELWHSWDPAPTGTDWLQQTGFDRITSPAPQDLAMHYLQNSSSTPCQGSLLIRRDTFHRLGGFEDRFRGMYEDEVLCLKMALGARALITTQSTLRYRVRPDSCCGTSSRLQTEPESRLQFLRWAHAHVRTHHAEAVDLIAVLEQHIPAARRRRNRVMLNQLRTRLSTPARAFLRAVRDWVLPSGSTAPH